MEPRWLAGPLPSPGALPWRRPRREALLLALVAVSTLLVVVPHGPHDVSRFCLTRALLEARLSADECLADTVDRASHGGHLYSDKAPELSLAAVPAAAAVRLPPPEEWEEGRGLAEVWAVRLSTVGLAFLACALVVGRIGEGLARGWGAPRS